MRSNPATRGTAPQRGVGPEVKQVSVIGQPSPSTGYIDVLDEFGAVIPVAPLFQVQPIVGEIWVITKALGPWSFAARLGPASPASLPVVHLVTTNTAHDSALIDVINALEALGMVQVIRS